MIKHFFTIVFIFFTNASFGQNLTLDQVIGLRTKSLGIVEEFLTSRNWEMITAEDESKELLGEVYFAYKKSTIDDKAESFIKFTYSTRDNFMNRVDIQINTLNKYKSFMTRLKALGYNLKYSKGKDGNIIKVYKGKGLAIEVLSKPHSSDFGTSTTYSFFICEIGLYYLKYE